MQLIAGRLFCASNKAIPELLFFNKGKFSLSSGEQVYPACLGSHNQQSVQLDIGEGKIFTSVVPLDIEIWHYFKHQKDRGTPFWLKIVLATILTVVALFFLSMELIERLPRFFPDSWSEKLADSVEEQLLLFDFFEESQLSLSEQAAIRDSLSGFEKDIDYRFYRFKQGANAFALPHKRIIISDQIVELFQGQEELLQAVVAHELGHIHYQHPLKQAAKSLFFTFIFSFGHQDIGNYANFILLNHYSRAAEEEADRYAVALLNGHQRAGKELFEQALRELHAEYSDAIEFPQWLSTHPSLEQRLENLNSNQPLLKEDRK